jgi:hypothetical protein
MAVKTFTAGEVLTAADTNTYLANAGLVYVSSAAVSNVTSFDVTGFTNAYSMFRVVVVMARHTGTGGSTMSATLRDATTGYSTGYYGGGVDANYLGTISSYGARNNGADIPMGSVYSPFAPLRVTFDIGGMNTTSFRPTLTGQSYDVAGTRNLNFGFEYGSTLTLSLDRMRFACAVGMTGNWYLYGYRTA